MNKQRQIMIMLNSFINKMEEEREGEEERNRMICEWLQIAEEPAVMRRSIKYAIVVGTILITINHGNALVQGSITGLRLLQMGLTVVVPYLVSTASSVGAIREARTAHRSQTEVIGGDYHPS